MNGQKLLSLVVRTNNVTVYSLISLWVFHLGNESRNSAISYRGKRSSENGIRPLHLTVFYMERRTRVYSGCFLIIDRVDSMNSRLIQSNWVWLCGFCYVTSKWNNRMKTAHHDNITLSTGFILHYHPFRLRGQESHVRIFPSRGYFVIFGLFNNCFCFSLLSHMYCLPYVCVDGITILQLVRFLLQYEKLWEVALYIRFTNGYLTKWM